MNGRIKMNALLATALQDVAKKLVKKNGKVKTGIHHVDTTVLVRITGTVTKLADTEKTPTVSIPLKATLALALQKAGIQRENIARILTEAMTEALNMDEQGEARIAEQIKDVEEAMARVEAITHDLPKTPVSGATNCKLTCEVEEVEPATV
jgi:hypothetical protein